jgi:hypothetical protein
VRTRRISLIAVDELTARRRAASQIGLPRDRPHDPQPQVQGDRCRHDFESRASISTQ